MDVSNASHSTLTTRFHDAARLRLRAGDEAGGARNQQVAVRERAEELASQAAAPPAREGDGLRTAVREALDYQRAERTMLRLRTQEGDVVQLRFQAMDELSMRYASKSDGERSSTAFSVEASSSSRLRISVEGDLNADEMSAIDAVIAQAGELAAGFFNGDVAAAFATASAFEIDAEQLASVNLRMSVQERFRLAQQVTTLAPPAPEAEEAPESSAAVAAAPAAVQPAAAQPAAVSALPADPAVVASTAAAGQAVASAQPATVSATPATQPAAVPATAPVEDTQEVAPTQVADSAPSFGAVGPFAQLREALDAIAEFLNGLTEMLDRFEAEAAERTSSEFSFSYGFKMQIVSAMISASGESQGEEDASAADLASTTIEEFAAQQDAQLDVSV